MSMPNTSIHVVIALVDCKRITTDVDSGDTAPDARIRRVEVIREDKDRAAVKPGRFYELRNGQVVEVTADGEAVA